MILLCCYRVCPTRIYVMNFFCLVLKFYIHVNINKLIWFTPWYFFYCFRPSTRCEHVKSATRSVQARFPRVLWCDKIVWTCITMPNCSICGKSFKAFKWKRSNCKTCRSIEDSTTIELTQCYERKLIRSQVFNFLESTR